MRKKIQMRYVVLAVSCLLIVIDQIIKVIVDNSLSSVITVPILKNVFHFTYVENRGAAFGLFGGNGVIISLITSVIIIFAIYMLLADKIKVNIEMWCVGLIIGGGIGNLIDRLFRGYVIDYIDLRIIKFAVFNFADCCVVVGAIMLIVYILFFSKDALIKIGQKNKSNEQK